MTDEKLGRDDPAALDPPENWDANQLLAHDVPGSLRCFAIEAHALQQRRDSAVPDWTADCRAHWPCRVYADYCAELKRRRQATLDGAAPARQETGIDPDVLLGIASELEATFDPGGTLPEDCEGWASRHMDVIGKLRGLAECTLMEDDE